MFLILFSSCKDLDLKTTTNIEIKVFNFSIIAMCREIFNLEMIKNDKFKINS